MLNSPSQPRRAGQATLLAAFSVALLLCVVATFVVTAPARSEDHSDTSGSAGVPMMRTRTLWHGKLATLPLLAHRARLRDDLQGLLLRAAAAASNADTTPSARMWLVGGDAATAPPVLRAFARRDDVDAVDAQALAQQLAAVAIHDAAGVRAALRTLSPQHEVPLAVMLWEPRGLTDVMSKLSGRVPLFVHADDLRWRETCEQQQRVAAMALADAVFSANAHRFLHWFADSRDVVLRWLPPSVATLQQPPTAGLNGTAAASLLLANGPAAAHASATLRASAAALHPLTTAAHLLMQRQQRPAADSGLAWAATDDAHAREHVAAAVDGSTPQLVGQAHVDVPAAGALLVADTEAEAALLAMGFRSGHNCVLLSPAQLPDLVAALANPQHRAWLDRMRAEGQRLVMRAHTDSQRADALAWEAMVLAGAWHGVRRAVMALAGELQREDAVLDTLCAAPLRRSLPGDATSSPCPAPANARVCVKPLSMLLPTAGDLESSVASQGATQDSAEELLRALRQGVDDMLRDAVRALQT